MLLGNSKERSNQEPGVDYCERIKMQELGSRVKKYCLDRKQGECDSASEVEVGIVTDQGWKGLKSLSGHIAEMAGVGGRQSEQSPDGSGVGKLHLQLSSLSSDLDISRQVACSFWGKL